MEFCGDPSYRVFSASIFRCSKLIAALRLALEETIMATITMMATKMMPSHPFFLSCFIIHSRKATRGARNIRKKNQLVEIIFANFVIILCSCKPGLLSDRQFYKEDCAALRIIL